MLLILKFNKQLDMYGVVILLKILSRDLGYLTNDDFFISNWIL